MVKKLLLKMFPPTPGDVLATLRAVAPTLSSADRNFILDGVDTIIRCDDFRAYDIEYVVGFAFTPDMKFVSLILKKKEGWQKNGLGGGVEEGETPVGAMVREFLEEGGISTDADQWVYFLDQIGLADRSLPGQNKSYRVRCYATVLAELPIERMIEEGFIVRFPVNQVRPGRPDMVAGLPALICLMHSVLISGKPLHSTFRYD